jgi:hypothetical protein
MKNATLGIIVREIQFFLGMHAKTERTQRDPSLQLATHARKVRTSQRKAQPPVCHVPVESTKTKRAVGTAKFADVDLSALPALPKKHHVHKVIRLLDFFWIEG